MLIRPSKLVLGLAVVLVGGTIVAAYTGVAEPFLTPSTIPGTPVQGFVAVGVAALVGIAGSAYLDRSAWKRTGRRAGLEPQAAGLVGNPPEGNRQLLPAPVLEGSAGGREVRARTYTVSTGSGDSGSSTTYTVVETALSTPVEWTALFGHGPTVPGEGLSKLGSMESTTVDGEYTVAGEVPADVGREILDDRVREALDDLEGGVAVGDVQSATVDAMQESLEGADDSVAGTIAQGMLRLADDGEDGPSGWVRVRTEGLLLDSTELERRIEAVAAVAESVERHEASR